MTPEPPLPLLPDGSPLPTALREVPYAGALFPGAPAASAPLSQGANCQRYAYAVLSHCGFAVPPLRSAELWADTTATARVPALSAVRPLDLVLFDAGPVPGRPPGYGAHVGIHLSTDRVLHLCAEVGRPTVWPYAAFASRPRYARFLGAKRPVVALSAPLEGRP